MNISSFIDQYPVSKTLRFSLIPQAETLANMEQDCVLQNDQKRADDYVGVKQILDAYHKHYMEEALSAFKFSEEVLLNYEQLYIQNDTEALEALETEMMKSVAFELQGGADKDRMAAYKNLSDKNMIHSTLPAFVKTEDQRKLLKSWEHFWTFFTGYNQNRANMYTGEGKHTEIAYRIVKQNLPKFLDDIKVWKSVSTVLPAEEILRVDQAMEPVTGFTGEKIFQVTSFNHFLSQKGIDVFNRYLGGYTKPGSEKVQGLNEAINLYSQQTGQKLPKLKPLFKQILSDRESVSFIPEMYASDEQVLSNIRECLAQLQPAFDGLVELLSGLDQFDQNHIYVANDADLTAFSNLVFGSWRVVSDGLERAFEQSHSSAFRTSEAMEKEKEKYFKACRSFSLAAVSDAARLALPDGQSVLIPSGAAERMKVLYGLFCTAREEASLLLSTPYPETRQLIRDDESITRIKSLLDSAKDLQHFVSLFAGDGEEADKDPLFYGRYEELAEKLSVLDLLYDRVRNYATQKPFSTDKIRVMFNRSDFLSGWAQKEEWGSHEAHLFMRDGHYYLFITATKVTKTDRAVMLRNAETDSAVWLEYAFQKPDEKNVPRLFVRSKGDRYAPAVEKHDLPLDDVIDIYDGGYFKTEYRKKDPVRYRDSLNRIIDYFKLGFSRHESYKDFAFDWKPADQYENITEFYADVSNSCYRITRTPINFNGLLSMVNRGMGYLFEIWSKDFSSFSHGTPNLHTLYFKALFDEKNAGSIRLQGGAQVYFRKASLKLENTTVHPAGQPINNKNPLKIKGQSTFDYDLIKDKRYTLDHFELHMPVALNFKAVHNEKNAHLNEAVREQIASSEETYVIGIDRGERNLLYVSVIDGHANIAEQFSLNLIENEKDGVRYVTDYHDLLNQREQKRLSERREWKTIESIKNIKEGYLSQAVHRICKLVEKFNAIIVMENLNSGFKNTRSAVEKSVYQKFEKMLCDKLSFMADKHRDAFAQGGIFHAYQLATPTTSYNDMRGQNGILFYVPAWLTSKIDPTTGFADLLHPRYETIERSRQFFTSFDCIRYAPEQGWFEFVTDLTRFPKTEASYVKNWVICTNGERIRSFRNEQKNNQWDQETVNLTEQLMCLMNDYGIDTSVQDLRPAITRQTEKAFFVRLTKLLSLTLQMRNSITGTDVDYLISPVANASGRFYDSREAGEVLPQDADANGAYNIARKGLWLVTQIREQGAEKSCTAMTSAQWLQYAQTCTAQE